MQTNILYVGKQVSLTYDLPMNEVILDFHDKLKSISRGYASLDYSFTRFQDAELVKLDILISGQKVDALASIIQYAPKARVASEGSSILIVADLIE